MSTRVKDQSYPILNNSFIDLQNARYSLREVIGGNVPGGSDFVFRGGKIKIDSKNNRIYIEAPGELRIANSLADTEGDRSYFRYYFENYVGYITAVDDVSGTASAIKIQSYNSSLEGGLSGDASANLKVGNAITLSAYYNRDPGVIPTNSVASRGIYPWIDNTYELGNANYRWSLIRGTTITPGDLAWEETECHLCGKKFKRMDRLSLIVRSINKKTGEPNTVPVHQNNLICLWHKTKKWLIHSIYKKQ